MNKILVLSAFAATSILLVQCAPKTSKSVSTSNESSPTAKVEQIKKTYTAEQLAQGKSIFEASCNKCHGYKMPETRNVNQWEHILPGMAQKSRLDEQQTALVRAWVLSGAKQGLYFICC